MSGSFVAELKRRNVHRAAVFYAASAWLIVQVATQVFPVFDLPAWTMRVVVVAAIVGFPFAMVFSWFYEWTPQGVRRESQVDPSASTTLATGRTLDKAIIAVLALAVLVLLSTQFVLHRFVPIADAAERSIAVLPFANTSGDAGNEYFSDGLSEELIGVLGRLQHLKVIGRTSSFQFKGRTDDSHTIGAKLGVATLLEGSVRKQGAHVRILAELINASDGRQLWSETYDRNLEDIFAVQSEIAGAVASQLQLTLFGDNARMAKQPTSAVPPNRTIGAYNALLEGNFYFARFTVEDLLKAIDRYEEAIRLDPGYALAYANVSLTQTILVSNFGNADAGEGRDRIAKARSAADTALSLDPSLGLAHSARGLIFYNIDLDLAGAERELVKAVELDPQDVNSVLTLGTLKASFNQLDEAVELERRATVLNPLVSGPRYFLARTLTALGRYAEADAEVKKAIEVQPGAAQNYSQLAIVQVLRGNAASAVQLAGKESDRFWRTYALALSEFAAGNRAGADEALEALTREWADSGAFQIASVHALRKEPEKMFEWLDHAYATRDSGLTGLLYAPFVDAYRSDPRFAAMCVKVGLPVPTKEPEHRG